MTTRIIRTRDPKAVECMIPHFTLPDSGDGPKKVFGARLVSQMQNSPETVNVLQAWRGDDLVGLAVATVSDSPFVWISQAWSVIGNSTKIVDGMFVRLILWTLALGRLSLRAETSRDLESFCRRFSFEPVASIVEHRISPEVIENILDRGKEIIHGDFL